MQRANLFLFFAIFSFLKCNNFIDIITFSYDRGMQLYATLESVERYFKGVHTIYVLYRTSADQYNTPYQEIGSRFKNVSLVRQGLRPEQDFKPLLLNILHRSQADYILFAVDDTIVKDFVDLKICINALEKTGAYAFYLRLGKNINHCYVSKKVSSSPRLKLIEPDIFEWRFDTASGDWAYPNSVDMTLFRKSRVLNDLTRLFFTTPNFFEGEWSKKASLHLRGLCFGESKIINIPMNLVQKTHIRNPHMNFMSKEVLLQKFLDGLKIDISKLYKLKNNSPHFEVKPHFIKRE